MTETIGMQEKDLDLPTAADETKAVDQAVVDSDGERDSADLVKLLEARSGVSIG